MYEKNKIYTHTHIYICKNLNIIHKLKIPMHVDN